MRKDFCIQSPINYRMDGFFAVRLKTIMKMILAHK